MITVMKRVFTRAYLYKFYGVCKTTDRYKTLELLFKIENVALLERRFLHTIHLIPSLGAKRHIATYKDLRQHCKHLYK